MNDWQAIVVALGAYPLGLQYAVDTVRNWLAHHAAKLHGWVDGLGYGWQLLAVGMGVGTAFLLNVSVPAEISARVHPVWLAKVCTGVILGGIAGVHHNRLAMRTAIKRANQATPPPTH